MANKNWMQQLHKLEGAITSDKDPHDTVIRSHSPSLNLAFGRGHGLPYGLTMALGGAPRGGKTLLTLDMAGALHQADSEAIVIRFDTEFRTSAQGTPKDRMRLWGIDPERFLSIETNSPMEIFDTIENDIAAKCQEGMPLRLVIIDSINGIKGRRSMNQDSIETQNIGDEALTLGAGFRRILGVQRKYGFAVILTCQIRAQMDQLEIKRGNKIKLSMPFAVQHYAEYHMSIEKDRNVTGRTDLAGNEFKDETAGDIEDKGDQTGHKIRARMLDNSCGPKGRLASFTINYNKGIINQFEEVFLLGKNRGVIERPNNLTYVFGDKKWTGQPATLEAIKNDQALQNAIMEEVFKQDKLGKFQADDAKAEAELED